MLSAPLSASTAARRWVETYCRLHRAPAGLHLAAQRVEDYFARFFSDRDLAELRPHDLERYRLWLQAQPARSRGSGRLLAPKTVFHVLADAGCCLRWCVEQGWIAAAPVPKRLLPRLPERPPERLSDEEAARCVALGGELGFLCRFALSTGLRWGELVRARTSHLVDGVLIVGTTKTGRVRRVPLTPALLHEIGARRGRLVPYSAKSLSAVNRQIAAHAAVPGFHVHRLRHTFAVNWVRRGGSLMVLQRLLGHATIQSTMVYGRPDDDVVRREAMRVFGRDGSGMPPD